MCEVIPLFPKSKMELIISTIKLSLTLHQMLFIACNDERRGWWKQIIEEAFLDADVDIVEGGVRIKRNEAYHA
jgi:hypothetical protein